MKQTLKSIGELVGCSGQYLSQVRTGKRSISGKILNQLTEEQRKIVLPPAPEEPAKEKIYTPYPAFDIMPLAVIAKTRDTEDIGFVYTDWHGGRITPDTEFLGKPVSGYNVDKFHYRTDNMLKAGLRIIDLHKPIKKAWLFSLGDMVQGENMRQGTVITSCGLSVYDQIHELVLPVLAKHCTTLLQVVEEVEIIMIPGNHGDYDKIKPNKTNWDRFLAKALQDAMANNPKVKVTISSDFCELVTIMGFRFFLLHGDVAHSQQGIPLIALRRKLQEYYALYQFHYSYMGHWHSKWQGRVNSVADMTICPSLVTGDDWALKTIGQSPVPDQLCFGIHPRKGRSFNYDLHTDPDYYPQPIDK